MVTLTGGVARRVAAKASVQLAADEVLNGTPGADRLDEAGRYTRLAGGDGNDTYIVNRAGVTITEWHHGGAGGIDSVLASVSFVLPSHVENLRLTGSGDIDGTGNVQANYLYGNDGANTLDGGDGGDTLDGGAGNDVLYGGAGDDRLYGGDGADTLHGGSGANVMIGGDGSDTYHVDSATDRVVEYYHNGAGGLDQIYASVSFAIPNQVEVLTLVGTADIDATGDDRVNIMAGNDGHNVMTGLGGDDTYYIGVGDTVVEQAGGGIDTVIYRGHEFTLPDRVENLIVENGYDGAWVFGNAQDNQLVGGRGDDLIWGKGGADWMMGGAGDDSYFVDNVGDVVVERPGEGTRDAVFATISYVLGDTIEDGRLTDRGATPFDAAYAAGGDDLNLTGNAGNNMLYGNSGRNVIEGGAGNDTLEGGYGSDIFLLSAPGINGLDTVNDFNAIRAGIDRIGLHATDYNLSGGTLAADRFQVGAAATGDLGTFVYDPGTHVLSWDADGAGAGEAVSLLLFNPRWAGPDSADDFVFV